MNNRVKGIIAVADPPPPPTPPHPLFLDQTDAQRAEKIVLETALPLSQGLDDFPPPHPPVI